MAMRSSKINVDQKTAIYTNSGYAVTASGWARTGQGAWFLDQNLTSKIMILDVPVCKGDTIIGFRIIGGLGAKTAGTTTLDADLRYNKYAAGSHTNASLGAITQISKVADYKINDAKDLTTPHVVQDGYGYFIKLTGTTANNAENDAFVTAAIVYVKRKYGTA